MARQLRQEGNLGAQALTPLWSFDDNPSGRIDELTVAGDRILYVAGGALNELDAHTGKPLAAVDALPSSFFPLALRGPARPCAAEGALFYLYDKTVRAVRLADGAPLWKATPGGRVTALSAVNGKVVVVSVDRPSTDGKPTVRGATWVTTYDASFAALGKLSADAGSNWAKTPVRQPEVGPVQVAESTPSAVALGDSALFFVADGLLSAVNIDGGMRWTYGAPSGAITLDATIAPVYVPTTPPTNGSVIAAGGTSLYAVNVRSHALRWTLRTTAGESVRWFSPALDASGRLLIAANTAGEVFGIDVGEGDPDAESTTERDAPVRWKTRVPQPGPLVALGDEVGVVADSGKLYLFRPDTPTAVTEYGFTKAATAAPVAIGNHCLYVPGPQGSLVARSFAMQNAATFDGTTSRIDVKPAGQQFDFGTGDFTVEAWVKTSIGGEIVSSYPTTDPNCYGFRLNMSPDGEIRAMVCNPTQAKETVVAGKTVATHLSDGEWHHVALVRRDGKLLLVLDGRSQTVYAHSDAALAVDDIAGTSALTIGAFRERATTKDADVIDHFCGLIREVRVWDAALDVPTLEQNMNVELVGAEPHLRGLWRLEEFFAADGSSTPTNAVARHRVAAAFVTPMSTPTDLVMDGSKFPYVLQQARLPWPYAKTWAVRGQEAVSAPSAVSAAGAICFTAGVSLYAVRTGQGERMWSAGVPRGSSAPVAVGNDFVVLTGHASLVRADGATGTLHDVPGFDQLLERGAPFEPPFAAPAISNTSVAAGSPVGDVVVASRDPVTTGPPLMIRHAIPGDQPVRRLDFGDFGLVVVGGADNGIELAIVDPAAADAGAAVRARAKLDADAVAVSGNSIVCVQGGRLCRLDATHAGLPAQATLPIASLPGRITGLACWPAADRLIATTDAGQVVGLSLVQLGIVWTADLSTGGGDGGRVNPPTFDELGNVFCTTSTGILAVLDVADGQVLGITKQAQPIVTSAVIRGGTAYFGCADAPADADYDGALHSLVIGEIGVLRAGVDAWGNPVDEPTYALVTAARDECMLSLLNEPIAASNGDGTMLQGVDDIDIYLDSCVEAWVNVAAATPAARTLGILGICPSGAQNAFDLSFVIDADGTLRYTARTRSEGAWSALSAQTRTDVGVRDGGWHHVAASRRGKDVTFYVDGAVKVATVTTAPCDAPTKLDSGLRAYVGATFDEQLAAASPFCGLIAEVRVWDAALTPTDISARMLVKLRGAEPDLMAYWNFDAGDVFDAAGGGHHGTLVRPADAPPPAWWLTHLPFVLPQYPYLVTDAEVVKEGDAEQHTSTQYRLSVAVRKANGDPATDQRLKVWYVRHRDDEPATVTVNGTELAGLRPGDAPVGDPPAPLELDVDAHGVGVLRVTTTGVGHGPSLDVNAGFMPADQRLHLNCLAHDQELRRPPPPSLQVQTRLIQDYSYLPGSSIDESRDRTTHRVVITAVNADRSPRSNEPLTLWTSAPITVDIGAEKFSLTPENPVNVNATAGGECVVAFGADALTAPSLYVNAGFMHRDARIVISPDADAQKQVAAISADDLTKPKVTNWKPGGGSPRDPLLDKDHAPHADKVADAVNRVMAAGASSGAPRASSRGRLLLAARPNVRASLLHMEQPGEPPLADAAPAVARLAGTEQPTAADADAFRDALGGDLGFVFAFDKKTKTLDYRMLSTPAEVEQERGTPIVPAASLQLGSFFGDLWDAIKTVAEDLYDAAVKIVVTIKEQVEVAVHKLEDVVHIVIETIKDAIDAVVGFFEQLALMIKELIEFLRALFNWSAILGAQRVIKRILTTTADALPVLMVPVRKVASDIFDSIDGFLGIDTSKVTMLQSDGTPAGGSADRTKSHANSVESKFLQHKFDGNSSGANVGAFASSIVPSIADGVSELAPIIEKLKNIIGELCTLDVGSIGVEMQALAKLAATEVVGGVRSWVDATLGAIGDGMRTVLDLLATPLKIPFVSALYKWATGEELSILSLLTLLMAFPVHIVYTIVTGGRTFADDAAGLFVPPKLQAPKPIAGALAAGPAPAATLGGDPPSPEDITKYAHAVDILNALEGGDARAREIVHVTLDVLGVVTQGAVDATFSRRGDNDGRALLRALNALIGMSLSMLDGLTMWRYKKQLAAAVGLDLNSRGTQMDVWGSLAGGLASNGSDLLKAATDFRKGSTRHIAYYSPVTASSPLLGGGRQQDLDFGQAEYQKLDAISTAQLFAKVGSSLYALFAVGEKIYRLVVDEDKEFSGKDPGSDLRSAAICFAVASIAHSLVKSTDLFYTQSKFGDLLEDNPHVKAGMAIGRGVLNLTSVTARSVAAFNYLGI